jgi:Zn-dependent protease
MIFFSDLLHQPFILIGFLAGITIAISIHEFAHAWTANYLGDPTAKNNGRLTLNPLAHLDPTGTIFLFLAGFGWGKPVPINPNNFQNRKWDQLWVSLSGPFSNILAALLFALPYRITILTGGEFSMLNYSPLGIILNVIVEINIILAIFNLLPIPPLDGAELISILLPERVVQSFYQFGPFLLFLILALEFLNIFSFFSVVFSPIINVLLYIVRVYPAG